MRCPWCRAVAVKAGFRKRIRRGEKELWFEARCYQCTQCSKPFLTAVLQDENDALAESAWQRRFCEPLPPGLPGTRLRRRMRTAEGRAAVARVFGRVLHQQVQKRLQEEDP